ncbi:hypothetical protein AB0O91_36655 [Kitasatospora sp. NPDC089797]|uniref:hypothetical protein n=1 Tax=Kitasatospora sp. NPDC089797 TaxID=3155298 RepID=UPI00342E88CA
MSTTTPPAPAAARKTAAKKATAKKAPAKRTAAEAQRTAKKTAAPARPVKKTAPVQRTAARPAAGKSPAKKTKKAPKSIGARAVHAARFAWEHPFLALVGTTAVAGTVLYRGVLRPTGKALALTGRAGLAVGSWAWDTGQAYAVRRRRSARPLTTGTHAHCRRCKGTGTLPRHDAHGRFLGSISCTG